MEALMVLTVLAIIYLAGWLCFALSNRLKIPNYLLLLISGIILGNVIGFIRVPELLAASISLLAIAIVLFDSISKLRELDSFSMAAMKFSIFMLVLTSVLVSTIVYYLFGIRDVYIALIFSVLVAGTDNTLVGIFKGKWITELLRHESLIIAPIIIIIPSILLEMRQHSAAVTAIASVSPLLSKFMLGIGAGVVMGILVMRLMRKDCDEHISFFILIAAVILTYLSAEVVGGSGILAVTAMAVLFGSRYLSGRKRVAQVSSTFIYALSVIVFVIVGMALWVPLNTLFLLRAFILFVVCLLLRFLALNIVFKKKLTLKEAVVFGLSSPKGLAVAVMMLALSPIYEMRGMLALLLAVMFYSMVVSVVTGKLGAKNV